MQLSIIIPTRNEADNIVALLQQLQPARDAGHEVLVMDGGSYDGTLDQVYGLADQATTTQSGRAFQQNEGAARSTGEVLWFLHADSQISENCVSDLLLACEQGEVVWGWFNVRLSGRNPLFRVIEKCMNWRSDITQIATGDQGLFMTKKVFEQVGGFPEIELMEDIALSQKLKAIARPISLDSGLVTSSRRWENKGILRTVLLMWGLRLAYLLGAKPRTLNRIYSA